jgi:hypothetical protein
MAVRASELPDVFGFFFIDTGEEIKSWGKTAGQVDSL